MKYVFTLQNARNGYEKEYHDDYDWEEESHMIDMWSEGNFSCDCNRSLFLYDHEEDKELECNAYENVIRIIKIEDETGKQICVEELND